MGVGSSVLLSFESYHHSAGNLGCEVLATDTDDDRKKDKRTKVKGVNKGKRGMITW